jgi:hypothetical protein
MGILEEIAKHVINRLNIDPNELFDDSKSSDQSKSSRRTHHNGDENDGVMKLAVIKREGNGSVYHVKTYEERVETERIKEDLVKLGHGYFIKKKPEKNYSARGSRFGGTHEIIRCRDYPKSASSCPCTIKIVRTNTKDDGGLDETNVYMTAVHNHKTMAVPKVGLDEDMKKKIEEQYKNGFSASEAATRLKVFDAEKRKKVISYCNNHRHELLDLKGEVETEAGWLETFNKYLPENLPWGFFTRRKYKHQPFILNFQFATSTDDLVIAFSTPSLMENMVKTFDKGLRVIQMDGTYKLNNKAYPLMIIGTTDRKRQFFPGAFAITKSEKISSFRLVARAAEDHCAKYFKASYQSCNRLLTVSDKAGCFQNQYITLAKEKDTPFLSDTTTIGMCYFHVTQSLPKKVDGGREHKEDMDVLAYVPAGYTKLFRNLYEFFRAKWGKKKSPQAQAWIKKLHRSWGDKKWSRAFLPPGAPQTNNAAESFNKHLKNNRMCKIRPSVHDSANAFVKELPVLSEKYAQKKFHANDDDRDYTPTEVKDAIVYRAKLERDGNFVFPFWKDDKNKTDIPDAVVFCRSGLIERITDQFCRDKFKVYIEGVRDDYIINAIRPVLEESAKNCYLTWLYIDKNDGKLPDYITTFDNWKEFVKEFYICRKLSTENIPKSGIPYSCACTEWRDRKVCGYQQTCKCKHVYTAAMVYAQYTIPETMQQHMKANKKRGRPSKRKKALEYQPGEMPSPEKVSKKARVEENDAEDIFEDACEACL